MLERKPERNEVKIQFRGDVGKATNDDLARADIAPADRDRDFLRVSAILCHAGLRNNNGDGFLEEDLRWALDKCGIFTPRRLGILDKSHDQHAYGAWSDAWSVTHPPTPYGHFAIQIEGVIWAWLFPDFANEVRVLYENGNLWFSMLCRYGFGQCSECGERFSPDQFYMNDICAHMKDRRENGATRWLREPNFLTSAKVDRPADEDCEGLAAASDEDEGPAIPTTVEAFEALSHSEKVNLYYALRDVSLLSLS